MRKCEKIKIEKYTRSVKKRMKDCETDDNWKNDRMKNRKYMHILEIMTEDNIKNRLWMK